MAALGIGHSAPVFVEVFPCGEVVCSATLPEDLRAIDRQGPERPVQQQSAFFGTFYCGFTLPVLSGAYICSQAYSAVASMKVIRDPKNWERTGLYRLAICDWGHGDRLKKLSTKLLLGFSQKFLPETRNYHELTI